MKRRLSSFLLSLILVFNLVLTVEASFAVASIDLASDSDWVVVYPSNGQFDYVGDQQTGSTPVSQDIVGDGTHHVFYVKYNELSKEIAFRVRLNNADSQSKDQFKNFVYVGMDGDLDGSIDMFLGIYNPTHSSNGRVALYASDPAKANISPSTTGIQGIIPNYGFDAEANINFNLKEALDGSSFSGNPDYFLSFKYSVDDINAAFLSIGKNIVIDSSSVLRYIVGTAAQDNSFNQDIAGLDESFSVQDDTLWKDLGVFSDPINPDGSVSNRTPIANDGSLAVEKGVEKSGSLSASDPDGDSLTYVVVSQGSKGTVTIVNSSTGEYTYMPNPGETGSDSFSFKVSDGKIDSNVATISVSISEPTPTNNLPIANDGSLAVEKGVEKSGSLSASDADGDSLTYEVVSQGLKGIVTIVNSSTGEYTYMPNPGETGSDSFSFKVNDGELDSNVATISVSISESLPTNNAPSASDGTLSVIKDISKNGNLSANDPDGDQLTYIIVSQASKGSVTVTGSSANAFIYSPNPGETGSDSFTFKVNDGELDSNVATISVSISEPTPTNNAPVANDGSLAVEKGVEKSGSLSANDPDGDGLTYEVVSQGLKGTVTIVNSSTGDYTYTPNPGQTGQDSFTFKVNDGKLDSNLATISITIKDTDNNNSKPSTGGSSSSTSTGTRTPVVKEKVFEPIVEKILDMEKIEDGAKNSSAIETLANKNLKFKPSLVAPKDKTSNFKGSLEINEAGQYYVEDVPEGIYDFIIDIEAPGGEKLAGFPAKLIVDKNGKHQLKTDLIDPYGIISDVITGEPIADIDVRLYWSDTENNKKNARVVDTEVDLPYLEEFLPNFNLNPQTSTEEGEYGYMVYADSDYYIIARVDGYKTYDSREDEREIIYSDDTYMRDGIIHVGRTLVELDITMMPEGVTKEYHPAYIIGYPGEYITMLNELSVAEFSAILSRLYPEMNKGEGAWDNTGKWYDSYLENNSHYFSKESLADVNKSLRLDEFKNILSDFEGKNLDEYFKFENEYISRINAMKIINIIKGRSPDLKMPNTNWVDLSEYDAIIHEATVSHHLYRMPDGREIYINESADVLKEDYK